MLRKFLTKRGIHGHLMDTQQQCKEIQAEESRVHLGVDEHVRGADARICSISTAVEIEQQERVGAYGRCNLGGQSTQVKDIDFADHLVHTQLLSRTQETITTFAVDVNAPKLAETSRCIFYTERRNQSYKWNNSK